MYARDYRMFEDIYGIILHNVCLDVYNLNSSIV